MKFPWTIAFNLLVNTIDYAVGTTGRAYEDFFGPYGYRTPEDYARDIEALLAAHPDRLTRHVLEPPTCDGRHIEVLRVRHPDLPEDAPRVLLTALLHAREFITGETAMEVLEDALNDRTPECAALVRRCEVDIIPIVNPDGVALNMERIRGWRERFGTLWRGNRRGVDLNRNFGGAYSNAHRTYRFRASDEFAGSGAFSEPETRALAHLCESRRYQAVVNLHSYSSVFLYPNFSGPEHDPLVKKVVEGLPALQPDEKYRPIQGSRFGKDIPGARLAFRAVRGTEWVHGTFDDWLLSIGTRSVLIEISRPGESLPEHVGEMVISHLRVFNPSPKARLKTIDNVLPAIYGFYRGILDGLEVESDT